MPLAYHDAEAVARLLAEARRSGRPAEVPGFALEAADDAYRIQDAVAVLHGPINGWKVGAREPGATPTCAPLLAGTIRQPAARHEIAVEGAIGVEVELAFVLGRAFAAAAAPPERAEILDAIASCHMAIELCATRWRGDPDALDPLWKLADNQINEGLVLGPPIAAWREADLDAFEGRLVVDGTPAETPHRPSEGDLIRLLVWLVRHCVRERGGMVANTVVTTGSWTGLRFVEPPAQVVGAVGAFPPIEVTLWCKSIAGHGSEGGAAG